MDWGAKVNCGKSGELNCGWGQKRCVVDGEVCRWAVDVESKEVCRGE